MNPLLERLMGMHTITDQVIATDLLNSAKGAVRNYAMAITEAISPEIRSVLEQQLDDAIALHEQIVAYMLDKGWYHPWNLKEQLESDIRAIRTAMAIP
ncbi:spore coat protein [Cohnella thailandensis]|uniref:Spore coat protein n=1 Tax=Cohnella thailandensis TaxID=557557 RepID=A0A841T6G7_9BACL|nr:spore coat protein [Cohnella thailandensis]MBB6638446.1 spore coat protein [Cohnella thailandensis]MBP1977076.1 hypothetical protein [Cohnella thailandensis]